MTHDREPTWGQRPPPSPIDALGQRVGQRSQPAAAPADTGDVRMQLLGAFRVWIGTRQIEETEWYLRKPRSLLKLLALAPDHRMQQEDLLELLWPALDRVTAAQTLTKALILVQRVLEPDLPLHLPSSYLHQQGDEIVLDPPGRLWIDVEAFVHAAQTAVLTRDPGDCEQALRLYPGDLLPDDRFESWTMEPRKWLQTLRLSLFSCAVSGWRGA